jgi:nucleotide-binding universal stress UspA family protein
MQISARMHENWQRAAVAAGTPKRKILCATDLTPRSDRAMQRTALLAQQTNAEVFFLHAVNDKLAGRVLRSKMNRAYARLAFHSGRFMKQTSGSATTAVRIGKPVDAVIAAAREYKPDLIVMARPKRRRLEAMIGTTAERIIRSTGCSMLLVGNAADAAYERAILATDLSATSLHVMRTAVEMGVLEYADTSVVHAFGLPYHDIATAGDVDYIEDIAQQIHWHSTARRDVLRNLHDAGVDLARVHVSTELGRPLAAIRRAVDDRQPEVLVIGVSRWFTLKRILIGSVADQLLRGVNCDILAISPPPAERKWLQAA